jgi:predicted nucleic acid-binding Zn ribbon protein
VLFAEPASELLLLASKKGEYGFYRWQNVAINVWASQPTPAAIQVMTDLTERSLTDCPGGIASIHWLDEGVALPTAESRVALSELAKRYEKQVLCVGVMLQGSGFWASATRSALTGIMLLAPRTFFLRFFSDTPELVAYIVRELAQRKAAAPEPERLIVVLDETLADFRRNLSRP